MLIYSQWLHPPLTWYRFLQVQVVAAVLRRLYLSHRQEANRLMVALHVSTALPPELVQLEEDLRLPPAIII